MDHQGAERTRSAADTRRQPPWPSLEGAPAGRQNSGPESTGPVPTRPPGYDPSEYGPAGSGAYRTLGPGTGPGRLIGSGSGPNQVLHHGSGPNQVLHRGSGPNPVLSRGSGPQPAFGAPGSSPGAWPAEGAYLDDDADLAAPLAPADGEGQDAGPGRRRGGRTRRRSRSRSWLAVAVVVVAAAGFAGYKFLYEAAVNAPVPPTLRLPTTAPGSGSPGFDQTLGKWQHIATRAEDPEPLTITGLYPPQFVLNGSSYVRTAASVIENCSLAVYGADLQAALQSGHCTQLLRASYISGGGKMMGTVGVVNLITASAAQEAGQVTGPQEIIAPLTGKRGATSKLGRGTGVVQAVTKGHYLILMWAQFTNLKSPSSQAQRQALEQFAANLVNGSANINLSTRMLTGKP